MRVSSIRIAGAQARRRRTMGPRRELIAFGGCLAVCVIGFFHESLLGGKLLSPADALFVSASFRAAAAGEYEPANRLLMDPVLQFQPWLDFNARMLQSGRLPLWNSHVGCGAPHLANGQSAVFDPFHLLAYLGNPATAWAPIAAGRLWVAGFGMFLLARAWGLRFWGRWFAGLVYPFCGFLVVWLLYPVTSVAIWMPWLFLATDALLRKPRGQRAGWLAVVVALVILGGHIQTSAHVLLAGGAYALFELVRARTRGARDAGRGLACWILGTCLGSSLAAVQILPLGFYLAKSPVWQNRRLELPSWWEIARPRVLDVVCTAAPYVYGSQRRGQPNLAKAIGVHNLNESAGGFAGLATLIWLAPLGVIARRRAPRVVFLTTLGIVGAMGAFRLPPIDNLLRLLPVLDVTDHRRLTLYVAFSLALLGGIGLDELGQSRRLAPSWLALWVAAAVLLAMAAGMIHQFGPQLRERATAHYRDAALATPGADPALYRERALRQVRQAAAFLPRYYGLVAAELSALATLACALRSRQQALAWAQTGLLALSCAELAIFGMGLNPALEPRRAGYEPPVIAALRSRLPEGARAVGVGEELPPNVLMRFGLADVRNYDSIELARNLEWFAPLFDSDGRPPSSRSPVSWASVIRARQQLRESSACAIVAAVPPPPSAFERVEQTGHVWIAYLDGKPWAECEPAGARLDIRHGDGWAEIVVDSTIPNRVVIRETWDSGWKALVDGKSITVLESDGAFLKVALPAGRHRLDLFYDPAEVKAGMAISLASLAVVILVLTRIRLFWIPGITMARGLDGVKPAS
jgi:hypothetical protein